MSRSATLRSMALLLSCLGAGLAANRQTFAEPAFAGATFEIGPASLGSAVGDMNGDGRPDLVTTDNLAGGVSVLISRGDGTFEPRRFSPLNVAALSMALNDLDLDGDLDLVATFGGGFGVALNSGGGHFGPLTTYFSPSGTTQSLGLVIADFNGDDSVDVAVSELATRSVYVYLSRGGFGSWDIRKVAAGSLPHALVAADFNGDGRVDLAAEGFCASGDATCAQGEIALAMGRGDGSFDLPVFLDAGPRPAATLSTGDFNGDGVPDLATANPNAVSVLFGAGGGSFRERASFDTDAAPLDLAVGDFNSDRIDDIAFLGSDRFTALLGREDRILEVKPLCATGAIPLAIGVADFNGDGAADLAINHRSTTLGYEPGYASVYLGRGDGTFRQRALSPGGDPGAMIDADLNEDGRPDLVVATRGSTGVSIFLNQGAESFIAAGNVPAGSGPSSALVSDFNGDGHSDVAVTNGASNDVSILLGDGVGHLAPGSRPGVGRTPSSIAAGDFNEDGVVDLAVTNSFLDYTGVMGDVSILAGVGDGTFAPESRISVGVAPQRVVAADFNRDGHDDLAVVSRDSFTWGIYLQLGRGDGTFALGTALPNSSMPHSMATADLNGDTLPDLVVSSYSGVIAAFLGRGDGEFLPPKTTSPSKEFASIVLSDFDGDGRLDLAARSLTDSLFDDKVLVLRGGGDGAFSPLSRFAVGSKPVAMIARDLDGDRRPDLAIAGLGLGTDGILTLVFNQHPGPDSDLDGIPDETDACTDTDQDGLGDPSFPANTCPTDNCPHAANPGQENGDHDALGDACDACTDSDHDGWGDAGYPQNRCAQDNCPATVNPFQGDADHDGAGDACDGCNDPDGDGYGSRGRLFPMTCPLDNCGNVYNPGQEDADGDAIGDLCDPCPHDAANDADGDGACGDVDNCPILANPTQADQDGDGRGDLCDNCPSVPNPGQADGNHDGSGDACQPTVRIDAIREDGGAELEVFATVKDPQGETLTGTIQILETETRSVDLPDLGTSLNCGDGIFPENVPGEGIGYANGSIGVPVLFNFPALASNFNLACYPWLFNYYIGRGTCDALGDFDSILILQGLPLPASICLLKGNIDGPRYDATVLDYDAGHVSIRIEQKRTFTFPFTGALPAQVDIPGLSGGAGHRLRITATDGNTPAASAESPFNYQGESVMTFRPALTTVSDILIDFASGPGKGAGLLTWTTDFEFDLVGFNVVTHDARGNRVPLSSVLIPCEECITAAGHTYALVLPKHKSGRNVFIEVVHANQTVDVFGPSRRK